MMATMLSSPLGPSAHTSSRYDIFDQPSSPTFKHAELPTEFGDQSFGSSMSLGSSFELNRMAASSSTSSQLSTLSVSALRDRRADENQATIRAPRRSPPRSSQDSLGAAMGTVLNSKSPGLAAKMNTSDYMDISSPVPPERNAAAAAATPPKGLLADDEEDGEYLPPGSAMKEDTPVKIAYVSRRSASETASSAGTSLGRLFGTELSLNNNRHRSFQAGQISKVGDDSFGSQGSPVKEPPSKRRPSSLPLVPGPAMVRPSLRSVGMGPPSSGTSATIPSRRPNLLKSMTLGQVQDSKSAKKRTSLEAMQQQPPYRASDSVVPTAKTFAMPAPRRTRSGSSSDEFDVLPRSSLPPLHPTIIESPSPSALQHEDFGTYFFDPQSPEHVKATAASAASISSRISSSSTAMQPPSRPRTFEKSATSAILPSMLTAAGHQNSNLGKRSNPYAKRPSLSTVQNVDLSTKRYGPAASTSNSSASIRMTAPAPRRCQSAVDNSAAFAQAEDLSMNSVDTSGDQSELMSPCNNRGSHLSLGSRRFPPGFDASGSPLAPSARPKQRPSMLRKTSKDDSSPLGYGAGGKRYLSTQNEGLSANLACDESGCSSSSSPYRSAEGMPGFGASEREGKILPCFNIKDDGLMRITPSTLVKVLQGVYADRMESYQVVDCRFGYEYEGGHIEGAINLSTMEKVKRHFLQPEEGRSLPRRSQSGKADSKGKMKKQVLIFHCEFSAKRAPSMALALRQADRALAHDYPNCHYPEVYILQGGYCGFFKEYADVCEPKKYVQMDDPKFQEKRSKELNGFRKQFSRHRSFTYGDNANNQGGRLVPHSDGTLLGNPAFGRAVIQEESSFDNSTSPSTVQADAALARRRMAKANPRIDTFKGIGLKQVLGSAPATVGDLSFGSSIGDDSFEGYGGGGGPSDSPCAAASAAAATTTRARPRGIIMKRAQTSANPTC